MKNTLTLNPVLKQKLPNMLAINQDRIGVTVDPKRERPAQPMEKTLRVVPKPSPKDERFPRDSTRKVAHRQRKPSSHAHHDSFGRTRQDLPNQRGHQTELGSDVDARQVAVLKISRMELVFGLPVALTAIGEEQKTRGHELSERLKTRRREVRTKVVDEERLLPSAHAFVHNGLGSKLDSAFRSHAKVNLNPTLISSSAKSLLRS